MCDVIKKAAEIITHYECEGGPVIDRVEEMLNVEFTRDTRKELIVEAKGHCASLTQYGDVTEESKWHFTRIEGLLDTAVKIERP